MCRYDVEAVRSMRQFRGHGDCITDMQLSEDARWLLTGMKLTWGCLTRCAGMMWRR